MSTEKIAYCFFGIPKIFEKVVGPSISKYLLLEDRQKYHIFVHTYSIDRVTNPRNGEKEDKIDHNEIFSLNPVAYLVDDRDEVDREQVDLFKKCKTRGDPWNNKYISLQNHLRQLHSINRVYDLAVKYGKDNNINYTKFVFCRLDVQYLRDCQNIITGPLDTRQIILPNWLYNYSGRPVIRGNQTNDRFGICDGESAAIYANRILKIGDFFDANSKNLLHSETYMKWTLDRYKVNMVYKPIFFNRVRANGKVKEDCRNLPK